jgi:hypothetical protein
MQSQRSSLLFLLCSDLASIIVPPRDDVSRPMAGARFFDKVNLQFRRCELGLVTQQRIRASKRVQPTDQSDSRLPESDHAMLKINIPQHSRGLMIAAERAVSS